jgi:multimeric flavodoxin WrbA
MMNIVIVFEGGPKTPLLEELFVRILESAARGGHRLELVELAKAAIAPCTGCLACLKSETGDCVVKDDFSALRSSVLGRDIAVILSPAIFGQCSSTIKKALDKGITGKLEAGSSVPLQLFVGYGADLSDEEAATFVDCVRKHLGKADRIHREFKDLRIEAFVARTPRDAASVAESIEALAQGEAAA